MPRRLLTEEEIKKGPVFQDGDPDNEFPLTEEEIEEGVETLLTLRNSGEWRGTSQKLLAPADIGQEEALKLVGQMLDERHYTMLVDETATVGTPEGGPICTLLRNRIPKGLLDRVRPAIRSAASQSVAAGNRVDAAGAGKGIRLRPDGTKTKMTGVPTLKDMSDENYVRLKSARDGTVGYLEDTTRAGQQLPCRLTSWTAKAPISRFGAMTELADAVAKAWEQSILWIQHGTQMQKASKTRPEYVLKTPKGILPFTTITCNNKWRTAAHIDSGDLKQGFGAMCCLGDFDGCDLVFPRYKLAVRYREGDILFADVANQVHGNAPLLNPDGTVPKLGEEPERLVCVFYYREQMEFCMSPDEETEVVNNWKKGKSTRAKRKKS
jgi:hypothetical protein